MLMDYLWSARLWNLSRVKTEVISALALLRQTARSLRFVYLIILLGSPPPAPPVAPRGAPDRCRRRRNPSPRLLFYKPLLDLSRKKRTTPEKTRSQAAP